MTTVSSPALVSRFERLDVNISARLFIGVPIPETTRILLQAVLQTHPEYIESVLSAERWHLTLAFLGEVENPTQYFSRLTQPLPQTYVPTVTLTHVGRGLVRNQLWAYANPSAVLTNLREQLVQRLRKMRFPLPENPFDDFVPHIHLADLFPMSRGVGMADYPALGSFAVPHVNIYWSQTINSSPAYRTVGTIPL